MRDKEEEKQKPSKGSYMRIGSKSRLVGERHIIIWVGCLKHRSEIYSDLVGTATVKGWDMAGNWKDSETKELLSIRSEEEIIRQLNGTVRDAVVYEKITQKLKERGVLREKTQVINKLKTLRKKFHQIKQRNAQLGNSDWPYFDMCHYIWGSGRSANPVVLLSPLEPYPSENDAETTLSDTDILKTEVCTEFVPLSPAGGFIFHYNYTHYNTVVYIDTSRATMSHYSKVSWLKWLLNNEFST